MRSAPIRPFNRALRTVLIVIAFATMPGAGSTSGEISGQTKKPPPATPAPQVSKSRLEVRESSGGIEHWVESLTITSPQVVTFRYSSNEPGATSAVWQVSDKPFSSGPMMTAAQAPHVIASGPFRPAPSNAKLKLFDIDFARFPKPLAKAPQGYWVFVVTKNAQNQTVGLPSPAVKIVHYATLELKTAETWRDQATKVWKLSLALNYAPADADIVVQRLKNDPFPDVWWASDLWINGSAVRVLKPRKISKISGWAGGGEAIIMDLPSDIGAGSFQAQVRTKNPAQITPWQPFSIHYPPPHPVEVVLKYLGLESLEETDEVGADEILVLSNDGLGAVGNVRQIGYHTSVDKGETHPAEATVYSMGSSRPVTIAVVEIDDGHPELYAASLTQIMIGTYPAPGTPKPSSFSGKSGKALLTPVLQFYLRELDELVANGDDLVTIIDLPSWNEDVEQCKKKPAGVRKEVIAEGDGGRFKLFFQLLAQPRLNK